MTRTLRHRGFNGSVAWSEDDGVYHGKILGIRDVVTYEGNSVAPLTFSAHGRARARDRGIGVTFRSAPLRFRGAGALRRAPLRARVGLTRRVRPATSMRCGTY